MEVTAIIPNWNGSARLADVIRDLYAQNERPSRILVIDNGSTDDSVQVANRLRAEVVRFPANRGFAAAVNAGVRTAGTELVAIVNNDVRLPSEWLGKLKSGLGESAFATGKLLKAYDKHIIDGCFDAVCRGGASWRCGEGRKDGPIWSIPRQVRFAPFTALLIRRAVFLDLGGLDEAFGSYLEDVDFGLRTASNGYSGRYVPEAVAYHEGSSTLGRWSPTTVRLISRNQLLLLARNYPPKLLTQLGWPIAVAQGLWGLVALRHGAGLAWFRGKIDGLRMFAAYRRVASGDIASVLGSGEIEIRTLQESTGWDWYWRMYFRLV